MAETRSAGIWETYAHALSKQSYSLFCTAKTNQKPMPEKTENPLLDAESRIAMLESQLKQAQENLKTSDARAESTHREIAARCGGVLPPKDIKAGNPSNGEVDQKADPKTRLAQVFRVEK
jgi:hypothetical protein